jgi:mercuric ion binding protein
MKKSLIALLLLATVSPPVLAAEQTVRLEVPGMTCAACPFTVRAALKKVEGVKQVEVSYEQLEAKVTFEDTQTSVTELTRATANAGYPSTVKEQPL